MQTSFTQKLNSYQKAVLHEIGVQVWQLDQTIELAQAQPSVEDETLQTAKESQQASAEKVSIPNKVLFLADADLLSTPFMQDICVALDVAQDELVLTDADTLTSYTDYRFAWQMGEQIDLTDNMLTTPAGCSSPHAKKQLWQQLQKLISAADLSTS